MPELTIEGKFRCKPVERWVQTAKTGTIGAGIRFVITHYYNPNKKDWFDCSDKYMMLDHVFWIYKADNSPIQFYIDALKNSIAWSGDILDFSLSIEEWPMPVCEIETANEDYNGKTRLRVKWLNPLGGKSGHAARVGSREQLEALKRRIGGQVSNKPTAPQVKPDSDDIPF